MTLKDIEGEARRQADENYEQIAEAVFNQIMNMGGPSTIEEMTAKGLPLTVLGDFAVDRIVAVQKLINAKLEAAGQPTMKPFALTFVGEIAQNAGRALCEAAERIEAEK